MWRRGDRVRANNINTGIYELLFWRPTDQKKAMSILAFFIHLRLVIDGVGGRIAAGAVSGTAFAL